MKALHLGVLGSEHRDTEYPFLWINLECLANVKVGSVYHYFRNAQLLPFDAEFFNKSCNFEIVRTEACSPLSESKNMLSLAYCPPNLRDTVRLVDCD